MTSSSVREQYEERVTRAASSENAHAQNLPQELSITLKNQIICLEWNKGFAQASVTALSNVGALQLLSACDLRILLSERLAPLDLPERISAYPGFEALVSLFNIPDMFLEERLHNAPYSFGSQLSKNENENETQSIWMHCLLKNIPSSGIGSDQEERAWVRTAFYLQWSLLDSRPGSVSLICFGALKSLRDRFMNVTDSQNWEDIVENPYILVSFFLQSWYERVDRVVWHANERGSDLETQTMEETENLESPMTQDKLVKLYRLLQMVVWLREGLQASLRAIELAIEHYQESSISAAYATKGKNLLKEILHRREMFRGTQLRLNALYDRLETINHISYNLAALHDNQLTLRISRTMSRNSYRMSIDSSIMRRDSSRMALIAWIGIILLPTSMVATIISAVSESSQKVSEIATKIGVLFGVSIPITIAFAVFFKKYLEPRSQLA